MTIKDSSDIMACSFCLKEHTKVSKLIDGGDSIYICNECVELCADLLLQSEKENRNSKKKKKDLYPKDICKILNEYIVGQNYAKKVISVGIYNHYKRLEHLDLSKKGEKKVRIDKSNILLVGPTGSGKTLIAKTIAEILNVPFAIADATSLTEAGYVGDDVESVLLRLLQAANNNVTKAERGIVYVDEIDKIASSKANSSSSRDVSGEGVQQSLLKIIEGSKAFVGKKQQQDFVQMDTTNILFICGGSFNGIEKIIEQRTYTSAVGFGSNIKDRDALHYRNEMMSKLNSDDLIKFGIIPEFVGRFPILATLSDHSQEELIKILTEPKNALTKQYKKMLAFDKIELNFSKDSLHCIAQQAIEKKVGARGLRSIIDNLMMDAIFDIKKDDEGSSLKVATKTVDDKKILTIKKNIKKEKVITASKV